MDSLSDAVRDRRARSITFELPDADGTQIEIDPPTMGQIRACVRLDPKPGVPESAAARVERQARQAAILLGREHAHLLDQLQPLQVAEIVNALYVAANGLDPVLYARWQVEQRKSGVVYTALQLLDNLEKVSIQLAARLSKMPSEIDQMPLADAVALREEMALVEKARADLQATIAGVRLTWH